MSTSQLFRGTFVETPSLGDLKIYGNHVLVVDDSGIITHFEDASSPASAKLLATWYKNNWQVLRVMGGSFILPTFCDLHLHAPQYLYQGNGLDLPLLEWLDKYTYKAEERLDSDPDLAKRVYDRLATRLIENGTGAVSLFGTIKTETNEILARSMLDAGIRARVGKLSMDISTRPTYVESSTSSSLEVASKFAADCCPINPEDERPPKHLLVEPVLTPRFVPTCSDELLSGLAKLSSDKNLHIQSHLAEAHDQVDWVKSTRGKDDIDVFDEAGLLTPRTLQAHCTYLTPPDLTRLLQKGTSIAHCPLSNIYFSVKPFPLREALEMGVKVGLGTDIAGGYSADIMSAMRNAVAVSRMREGERLSIEGKDPNGRSLAITWVESLYLATRGGAIALGGRFKDLGTFKVGAPFDAQRICLLNMGGEGVGALDFFDLDHSLGKDGALPTYPISVDMVEKWWCVGDARQRKSVWVQGEELLSKTRQ